MPRIEAISKRTTGKGGGGCATVALTVFIGLFVAVGTGAGVFLSMWPLYQVVRARSWTPTPCEVISSRVVHNDETSRPEIVYRYVVDDRVYTANRYDFLPGSNSDADRSGAVATHPPGSRFECYVDPGDPTRAVINRSPTAWYFFGLAFFAVFAVVPGTIAIAVLRMSRREAALIRAASVPGAAVAGDPRFGTGFGTVEATPLVLVPETTAFGRLVAVTAICLFWNGIVGVATYFEARGFIDGKNDTWIMALFLLLFQAVGVGLLVGVVHQLLALANPRPILTLSRGSLPLGTAVPFTWELSGAAHRVGHLTITLRGREEAKYRQGTDTKTDTHDFHTQALVDTSQPMTIARGTGTIALPAGTMHTFTASHNKVIWTLQVVGSIPRWPDINETFDVTVKPV